MVPPPVSAVSFVPMLTGGDGAPHESCYEPRIQVESNFDDFEISGSNFVTAERADNRPHLCPISDSAM